MNSKENLKTIVLWWLGTFIALILVIFNTIFYTMLKHSFYDRVENSLSIIANQVKDNFIPVDSPNKIVTIPQKLDYPVSPVMIAVFGAKNMKIVAKSVTFMDIKLGQYLKSYQDNIIVYTEKYGKVAIKIIKIISPIKGYIVVATPLYKIDIKLQDIFIKMIILNPILLILLLLGANVILDKILNPIKNIIKTANEISVGDLDRIIPLPLEDNEIKELVKAFNAMVIRLRNGIEMIHRFNSDVSHELKTPLSVLKGEIELALRKERSVDYYKETLNISLKEVNYLIEMVEEMLLFTKIENEVGNLENVKLDEVLLNVISKLSQKADSKNIKIELEKLDIIEMNTNKFLVQTIFINIIDNAIKYSKEEGGKILISLFKEGNNIIFKVKDNGIGINENEIENLTERFYRVDKARNRGIKGFGLGLSIVQKALEILDGKIEFISEEDKGTEVIIKFKGLKNV